MSGWQVYGRRTVYASPWLDVELVDVESPDGHRVPEHHAIRMAQQAAGVVVLVDGAVLLMWRHRFIPGSTGWEIPAGRTEPGEPPVRTAARECLEETGFLVGALHPLVTWHPSPGISDQTFRVFLTTSASRVADPVDVHEAERIEFVPSAEVARAVDAGEIADGMALVPLLTVLRRR